MLWKDQFTRLGRKLQGTLGRPMVAVAIDYDAGNPAAHTRLMGATYGELEFAAKAILSDISRNMREGDHDPCPCCADRMKRVEAAMALLEPGASAPITDPTPRGRLH